MQTKGIRILDTKNNVVSVKLQDILEEISYGNSLQWSLLFFYGQGHLKNGKSIQVFEEEVRISEKGISFEWNDLNIFADSLFEIIDILIIGCKTKEMILRYETDQEMYESCDIVIEMFDSSFWEIFSNDDALINRLAEKFKKIQFINSDFLDGNNKYK